MTTTRNSRRLRFTRKDGSILDRYLRVTETRDAGTTRRFIELMMTPDSPFKPESTDTSYKGCGVKTAQNVARWFDIAMSQSTLRKSYVETSDMTKWANTFLNVLDFLIPFVDIPGLDPRIMTTPAQLVSGIRKVLDTRFDRRFKVVRHSGADKESTVAKIEHYLLHGFPAVALVCNGSHWVTISAIETLRRDSDGELLDVTFTVHNNSSIDTWSWKKLHFWFTDAMDEFADAARAAGYTSYRQGTLLGVRYDHPAHQYDWSSGWTHALFYGSSRGAFLFLLKSATGDVHIHSMNRDGSVGARVVSYDWSGGWTTADMFQTGKGQFLFLLKQSSGEVHIHKMEQSGAVGQRVATYDWSGGWSHAEFFEAGGQLYLFLLKQSNGVVHIHKMNDDGSVGARVAEYDWSSGWTMVRSFIVGGRPYLFLLKAGDGTVHIHRLNDDGSVGQQVASERWSSGWTVGEFIYSSNKTLLLIHKEGDPDGLARIHEMNTDGSVGAMTDDAYWMSEMQLTTAGGGGMLDRRMTVNIQSWPVLRVFSPEPNSTCLFQLCTLDGQVEIHPFSLNGKFNDCF
ncbi:MAG: hypothetical protein JW764_05935 [Chlorobiaceae bacterium]|nr:hypothetical protein [Chlorobiaceae bacterium]